MFLVPTTLADGGHTQEQANGRGRKRDGGVHGRGDGDVVNGPVLLVDDIDLLVVGGHSVDPGEIRAYGDHARTIADADVGEQDLLL